ncbi:MAG: hypothetical protein ABW000_18335 [Actinoplanes sp.]
MPDEYYGWEHVTIPGYAGIVDDYTPTDQTDPNNTYSPTDYGYPATDIEKLWTIVQAQSDEDVRGLAERWRRTSVLLQATRDNLQRHADALAARWQSPAGKIFMSKVGATLYSFDEWKKVADDNASGLHQVADKIAQVQRDFKPVYERYLATRKTEDKKVADDKGFQGRDIGDHLWLVDGNNGKTPDDVKKDFHDEAVGLVRPLGNLYIDVYIDKISRGSKFKGPTNSVFKNPEAPGGGPSRPPAPSRPPGARPGRPAGAAPARPTTPNGVDGAPPAAPNTPTAPPPPGLPDGVSLAGGTVAPAPPAPPPAAPPVTSAPGAPPPSPVLPAGLPGRPGTPPTGPGAGRPGGPGKPPSPPPGGGRGAPGKPTLPGSGGGRSAANARGPAPAKPTLPGSTGPGGGGGSRPSSPPAGKRGAAPGAPRLPGSTGGGKPGAPRLGGPGQGRSAPPPSLGGNRGSAPGEPGANRPGKPAGPKLPGRGNGPGTPEGQGARPGRPGVGNSPARPDLTGRTNGAGPKAPTTGPKPALGGRQVGPPPAQRARGRAVDDETWEYADGDDELWVTESDAVGTIDAPAEHRPQQQGKALGQD